MANFPGSVDIVNANGLFKRVYDEKLENIIPLGKKVCELIEFNSKKKTGDSYNMAVILQLEHGVTYEGPDAGAFALNNAINGAVKQATLRGNQIVLRSAVSYESIFRSEGKEQAFTDTMKYLVMNMMDSIYKKLEIELLYGQDGLGVVAASPAPTATSLTITDEEFAAGIWAGSKNMKVDIYNGVTLVGTATIQKADIDNRALILEAPGVAGIAAGHKLFPQGAFGKQMAGMKKIMENTGLLFGIDAAQYELWEGTEYTLPTTDVLSFAIIQQAITKGVNKGLDKDVVVLCNPGHWDDLLTEQSALRKYDQSYTSSKAENGAMTIKFYSQNGQVEIVPYIHVKEGHAFIICKEDWKRIGSTDVTFKRPGQPDKYFRELDGFAGVEMRAYTDQALMCSKIGRQVIIKNLKVS